MASEVDAAGQAFSAADVVELRQYTLHPGARIALVQVFEDHFIEGQERVGIRVGGICVDENDPDRFVWFRGFTGLEQRVEALESFYDGPIWAEHGGVASRTMIDSDDVLLLQPTIPAHQAMEPSTSADSGRREDRLHVSVYAYPPDRELEDWLTTELHRLLEQQLAASVATWRSHPGPNGFPRLPVRADNAFVWAASFADADARQNALDRLQTSPEWAAEVAPRLQGRTAVQDLALRPTSRSKHPRPRALPTIDEET